MLLCSQRNLKLCPLCRNKLWLYGGSLSQCLLSIDYAEDGAEIRISCQARAWLYAVIVVVIFIIGTLIFCGIVVCVKIVKSTSSSSRSRATNTAVIAGTTTESSFTKSSSTVPVDYGTHSSHHLSILPHPLTALSHSYS